MINKIWEMYYEGYTTGEIARELKVNESYVVSVLGLG